MNPESLTEKSIVEVWFGVGIFVVCLEGLFVS